MASTRLERRGTEDVRCVGLQRCFDPHRHAGSIGRCAAGCVGPAGALVGAFFAAGWTEGKLADAIGLLAGWRTWLAVALLAGLLITVTPGRKKRPG